MPDNRVQGIVGGFAAGTTAGLSSRNTDLAAQKQQQDQQNLMRERADASVKDALTGLEKASKQQSAAYFTSKGLNDQKGMDEAIKVQTEYAKVLWKSTQEMLKSVGATEAEIANVGQQFRIGASLNNPAAEQKLIAAGEAEAKVQPALDTERGKGVIEQQQVQTGDIKRFESAKTGEVTRGFIQNGRAFQAETNTPLSPDFVEQTSSKEVTSEDENAEFLKFLARKSATSFNERHGAAKSARKSLQTNQRATQIVDEGIISGTGANVILGVSKSLSKANLIDSPTIENTEAFVATMARQTAAILSSGDFGAGTGLSDKDLEFATKMAGGEITLTEDSIRKIIYLNNVATRELITQFNTEAAPVDEKGITPFPFSVEFPVRTRSEILNEVRFADSQEKLIKLKKELEALNNGS